MLSIKSFNTEDTGTQTQVIILQMVPALRIHQSSKRVRYSSSATPYHAHKPRIVMGKI